MSDNYSHKIRGLDGRADDLESDLASLRSKFGDVDDLDYELRDIRDDISTLQQEHRDLSNEVSDHVEETESDLRRFSARLQVLEAHVKIAAGVPEADFDTIAPDWAKLARAADLGQEIREGLLPDWQRQSCHLQIAEHQEALKEQEDRRASVVAAALILSSTPRTSREHKQAADDFHLAAGPAGTLDQRVAKTAAAAATARASLRRDERLRREKTHLVEEGDKARKKLHWQLRGLLAKAISDRVLLPVWFVTVLGPVPPAARTQEWMDAGMQVLVYRITYGITDPVVALGPKPDVQKEPRRASWYQELKQTLRPWR
ncbi:hypothetical protein ACIOUE_37930 [Streptomyces xanthochromogenes]|uniref:hypothetical protein n=1 Tax=Streptomyces xanthochromogenes TaxID=67384 RepID=UPI0037F27CFB